MIAAPARLDLSGADWLLKDYVGEDWLWRNAHKPGSRDVRAWRPATVPGSVQHDLWQAGEIPDPYFERNTLLIEWTSDRTWLYKKSLVVPEDWRGRHVWLHFEGVDYEARFFLNGERVGRHEGMFTPAVFDVSDRLHYGQDNLVAVVIDPAPLEQPQVGYTSRVRTTKTRMNYWWDFCPRLVHLGLWGKVFLEATGPAWLDDVFARPRLQRPFAEAGVEVTTAITCQASVEIQVTTTIRLEGREVASHSARRQIEPGTHQQGVALSIPEPRLWWPNGHGEQPLYTAEVVVADAAASVMDRRQVTFGLRHLAWAPNLAAAPAARPYTLVVNGRPIYIKGWNWVPLDVLYGVERQDKLEHLLTLAHRAHVNVLRVWGGGLIEREAFYEQCDRLGLLVWQEFIQSSSGIDNIPPDTPEYIEMWTRAARQFIPRRRNHPSLAIWCGGNELQAEPERPLDESHPTLAALRAVVHEMDPDRLWLPTSSSGPVFSNSLENLSANPLSLHDVHGPWEHQGLVGQFTLYNRGTSLLHSEFGVEGITNRRSLDRTVAREHQEPVTLDSPYWRHLGAWWVKEPRWREMLGGLPEIETLTRAMQYLQASGLQYAVEANRRRKFQNSGSLPWQFNEPYPMAACTSAVDYYGEPKPAYYAVMHAYSPVHVSARFERQAWAGEAAFAAEVWANSSLPTALPGAHLRAALVGLDGREYAAHSGTVEVAPNAASLLAALQWPLAGMDQDVFLLDLALSNAAGQPLSANRYLFSHMANLAPALAAPATQVAAELEVSAAGQGVVEVRNEGAHIALFVWLERAAPVGAPGYVYFGANHFCLLPGETRLVAIDWAGPAEAERQITLRGWNTNALAVG